jgi:hypothetical protein
VKVRLDEWGAMRALDPARSVERKTALLNVIFCKYYSKWQSKVDDGNSER